jgi:hypothetical protein
LSDRDLARLAAHLGLSSEEFRARYTREFEIEGQDEPGLSLTRAPHGCVFLDDATNACTVHDARPDQCRAFPFWPPAVASRDAWERLVVAVCDPDAFRQGRLYTRQEVEAMTPRLVATGTVRGAAGAGSAHPGQVAEHKAEGQDPHGEP